MTPNDQLAAIRAQFRADGYCPVARYGKGEYLHEDGYRMRTVRLDPTLGWIWIPSISRSLLIRSARQAVAARG